MVRLAESTNTTLARDGSHVLPRLAVVLCRLPRLGSTTANTARESRGLPQSLLMNLALY